LCGHYAVDQDSQALAGLSKGILSLPLNRGVKLFLLTLNCTRYDAVSKRVSKLNLFCAWDNTCPAAANNSATRPEYWRRMLYHHSVAHSPTYQDEADVGEIQTPYPTSPSRELSVEKIITGGRVITRAVN
jgi:hypothetical protein